MSRFNECVEKRQIAQALAEVNADNSNPLLRPESAEEMAPFLQFEVPMPHNKDFTRSFTRSGRKRILLSEQQKSNANDKQSELKKLRIDHYRTPLPEKLHHECMRLFEENMTDLYLKSSWGLDLRSKSRELKHPQAHFFIVTAEHDNNEIQLRRSSRTGPRIPLSKVLAFCHFRYETADISEWCASNTCTQQLILYVYELQVSSSLQRCGVGKRIMSLIECLVKHQNIRRSGAPLIQGMMLTVFTHNSAAMEFYTKNLSYRSSPLVSSENVEDEDNSDYEILFKSLV